MNVGTWDQRELHLTGAAAAMSIIFAQESFSFLKSAITRYAMPANSSTSFPSTL